MIFLLTYWAIFWEWKWSTRRDYLIYQIWLFLMGLLINKMIFYLFKYSFQIWSENFFDLEIKFFKNASSIHTAPSYSYIHFIGQYKVFWRRSYRYKLTRLQLPLLDASHCRYPLITCNLNSSTCFVTSITWPNFFFSVSEAEEHFIFSDYSPAHWTTSPIDYVLTSPLVGSYLLIAFWLRNLIIIRLD